MRGLRAPLRLATGLLLLATVMPAVGDEPPRYNRLVIEAAGLKYETLKNGDRPEKDDQPSNEISAQYNIEGFPTLVIVDAEGIVRLIHCGYAPNLRESLSGKIRELLVKK